MKPLTIAAIGLLLCALLVLPALAEKKGHTPPTLPAQAAAPAQDPGQPAAADPAPAVEGAQDPHQSDAFLRQQAYQQKREEMKRRRDEALKIREQNAN